MYSSLVVDAQLHIWSADGVAGDWPEWGAAVAAQHGDGRSPSAELLVEMLDGAGVAGALLTPPSFAGDSNLAAVAAAAAYPARFAAIGRVPLALTGPWRSDLAGWTRAQGLVGLRLTFGPGESTNWLNDGTAAWIWPAAERAGIPLLVSPRGQFAAVAAVAAAHPDLRLVIDHLGLSPAVPPEALGAHIRRLNRLSERPNVAVKATALPLYAVAGYPFTSLRDHLAAVLEAFGVDRVFWGSDATRLNCTYQEAVGFLAAWDLLTPAELAAVMGQSLCEWIGWCPAGAPTTPVRPECRTA